MLRKPDLFGCLRHIEGRLEDYFVGHFGAYDKKYDAGLRAYGSPAMMKNILQMK